MNFELFVINNGGRLLFGILLLIFIGSALSGRWRNHGRLLWDRIILTFLFSVTVIWISSDFLHEYALWRVSVYDADGVQSFPDKTDLDPALARRLMDIVVHDTGKSLQPLGAIVVSTFFLIVSLVLSYAVALGRRVLSR